MNAPTNTQPKSELIKLIDDTDNATTKALAFLKVMSGFLAECRGTLYNQDELYWTTQAAIDEIEKIGAAVKTYTDSQK